MTLADYGRFVFVRERNHKLAEEVLERALAVDPDYAAALFYMGMVLLNNKNQAVRAHTSIRLIVVNSEANEKGTMWKVCLSLAKYRNSMRCVLVQHEAEKHFRRCLANNPGHSGANQYLARILTQDKRRKQNAAEYYQKGKLRMRAWLQSQVMQPVII
jgi:tetratricopeptide (TPR) repeat protein